MDNLISLLSAVDLEKVVAGSFDITLIPAGKQRGIVIMGAHCCLNGPVGTNKPTTFPLLEGQQSISGYMGFRVSNSSWRAFCQELAVTLRRLFGDVCRNSQQVKVAGDLWPTAPSISEMRKK